MAKKQKTISDYWGEIPLPVKIGAYALTGLYIYNKITKAIAAKKAADLLTQTQNPVYNLPGGSTTLPGGTTIDLPQTFNAAQKAQTFYYFFNPEGWTSDEKGMIDTILSIPAAQFKNVAAYYAQAYPGRDMRADADSQLSTSVWGMHWNSYKTQIPII